MYSEQLLGEQFPHTTSRRSHNVQVSLIPSWLARMPRERARASPSEAGSMPVNSTNSICPGCLRSLYIKSLPILPDPMIATFTLLFAECCAPISRSPSFHQEIPHQAIECRSMFDLCPVAAVP